MDTKTDIYVPTEDMKEKLNNEMIKIIEQLKQYTVQEKGYILFNLADTFKETYGIDNYEMIVNNKEE